MRQSQEAFRRRYNVIQKGLQQHSCQSGSSQDQRVYYLSFPPCRVYTGVVFLPTVYAALRHQKWAGTQGLRAFWTGNSVVPGSYLSPKIIEHWLVVFPVPTKDLIQEHVLLVCMTFKQTEFRFPEVRVQVFSVLKVTQLWRNVLRNREHTEPRLYMETALPVTDLCKRWEDTVGFMCTSSHTDSCDPSTTSVLGLELH